MGWGAWAGAAWVALSMAQMNLAKASAVAVEGLGCRDCEGPRLPHIGAGVGRVLVREQEDRVVRARAPRPVKQPVTRDLARDLERDLARDLIAEVTGCLT